MGLLSVVKYHIAELFDYAHHVYYCHHMIIGCYGNRNSQSVAKTYRFWDNSKT